jgi:hypothetical protein
MLTKKHSLSPLESGFYNSSGADYMSEWKPEALPAHRYGRQAVRPEPFELFRVFIHIYWVMLTPAQSTTQQSCIVDPVNK